MSFFYGKKIQLSPVSLAFWGSLLLSLIAVMGVAVVPRDAALYIDVAQQISEQGVEGAQQRFNWPWFSLLLAGTHYYLGLPLEFSAYFWCALFMAGACALLVSSIQRITPESGYWACLVVLSIPAFNSFRDDILREFGFWFFSALALWLALRWRQKGGWFIAAFIHLAIVMASLFRLEAILLLPVLYLWCWSDILSRQGWGRLLQLSVLPMLGVFSVIVFLVLMEDFSQRRIEYYLALVSPKDLFLTFNHNAETLAVTLFRKWLHDEARMIYGIMLLGIVGLFFVKLCGFLAILFMHRSGWRAMVEFWRSYRIFAWGALLYVVVLLVFLVRKGFINPRYTSYLNFLCIPLLTIGIIEFYKLFPRLGRFLVVLLLIQMLANVISLSDKKARYVEAGEWMSEHLQKENGIYYEDGRVSYYAGWGYVGRGLTREKVMSDAYADKFNYFVFDVGLDDEAFVRDWVVLQRKRVLAEFTNPKGKTILIIGEGG